MERIATRFVTVTAVLEGVRYLVAPRDDKAGKM